MGCCENKTGKSRPNSIWQAEKNTNSAFWVWLVTKYIVCLEFNKHYHIILWELFVVAELLYIHTAGDQFSEGHTLNSPKKRNKADSVEYKCVCVCLFVCCCSALLCIYFALGCTGGVWRWKRRLWAAQTHTCCSGKDQILQRKWEFKFCLIIHWWKMRTKSKGIFFVNNRVEDRMWTKQTHWATQYFRLAADDSDSCCAKNPAHPTDLFALQSPKPVRSPVYSANMFRL